MQTAALSFVRVWFAPVFCMLFLSLPVLQQSPTPAQSSSPHDAPHHDGVTSRGDHAMGFSHETTAHHFLLCKTGGAIDVSAKDAKDSATRDQIRMHLAHVSKRFAAGDFDVPMFIHDTTPPGAATMAKLRDQIRYLYGETPSGGKIQISTENREALDAIHAFLRFQISDHRTGDGTEVQ
jgi:hypothetical protein